MKPPLRPADPFAPVRPRPAEAVRAHETTPEDIQRLRGPQDPARAQRVLEALQDSGRRAQATRAEQQRDESQEQRERALVLCRGGTSAPDAAQAVGVPTSTVKGWCIAAGVKPPPGKPGPKPQGDSPKATAEQVSAVINAPPPGVDLGPVRIEVREDHAKDERAVPAVRQDAAPAVAPGEGAGPARATHAGARAGGDARPPMRPEASAGQPAAAPRAVDVDPELIPPQPPAQHWEVYVGPPRAVEAEREAQRLRERLFLIEHGAREALRMLRGNVPPQTSGDERRILAGQILEAALAAAPPKAGGTP